jgi:isopenicillin N synthase-like dioxygenase
MKIFKKKLEKKVSELKKLENLVVEEVKKENLSLYKSDLLRFGIRLWSMLIKNLDLTNMKFKKLYFPKTLLILISYQCFKRGV